MQPSLLPSNVLQGQEHAIRHVVEGRGRLLVVEKTGWGKSFVYFIATRLLREAGNGPALLVSPLRRISMLVIDECHCISGLGTRLSSSLQEPI